MNAYIASFMLLLFNAVGLAVPASAAAAERVIPELGSAANLSEAAVADQAAVIEAARLGSSDHQSCAIAKGCFSGPLTVARTGSGQQIWAIVAMRSESGDKLEHEEGAP